MAAILGVTATISSNTASALLVNDRLTGLVEEERFTGIKHAPRTVPAKSMAYVLHQAGLSFGDLDAIAVGFQQPLRAGAKSVVRNAVERNWERILREPGAFAEYFLRNILFKDHVTSAGRISAKQLSKRIHYIDHHLSHAASAARVSGFDRSVVITWDGVGENCAGLVGTFRDGEISVRQRIPIRQSLGWLYSTATALCGFKSHSHEGKLMGLAAYGEVREEWLMQIGEISSEGYRLHHNWISRMSSWIEPRRPSEPLVQIHMDLAATVQYYLQTAMVATASREIRRTGISKVVLAGGVALNCDANAMILALPECTDLFVQPAANDAGTGLGAALELNWRMGGASSVPLAHAYYGPEFTNSEIRTFLKESKLEFAELGAELPRVVAQLLAEGKIVGHFAGRSEFGPRALGGRSILALPRDPSMKDRVNREVKHREEWRPFAPSVLAEHCDEVFINYYPSPFMLLTFATTTSAHSQFEAATHVDGTARVQEVRSDTPNSSFRQVLELVYEYTGVPGLLNTSFNDHEKPICLSPRDAVQTFYSTGLDALALGDFLLTK